MRKVLSRAYKSIINKEQFAYFKHLAKFDSNASVEEKYLAQKAKLSRILHLAKNNIEYYKSAINLNPDSFDYSDFIKIPFLNKDLIGEHLDQTINPHFRPQSEIIRNTSGGSTGRSAVFFQTRLQNRIGQANYWLALHWNGIDPSDRSLDLWGAERDMYSGGISGGLKQFIQNRLTLNTFVLNDKIISHYVEKMNVYKPAFIKAYVHSAYEIAKYINRNQIRIKFRPVIHTSTGPLYPEMKREISQAFNDAHVYSFYGSREVSAMASNVPGIDGMRVMYDNVLLEIVDQFGRPVSKGEEGEIVVTTLNNEVMPLIRYKIGDRAVKNDDFEFGCLYIGDVLGRTLGVLYRKDGTHIDGQFFVTLFFNLRGIDGFQIVQEDYENITLNIVKGVEYNEQLLNPVMEKLKTHLPDIRNITINTVPKIELTTTGKIMYVFSKIKL